MFKFLKDWRKPTQKTQKTQKEVKNDDLVGQIFYNSWGYEQTNLEYYQVVRQTPKTVLLREISQEMVKSGRDCGDYKPEKDNFLKDKPEYRAYIRRSENSDHIYLVGKLDFSYTQHLHFYSGGTNYKSWYH